MDDAHFDELKRCLGFDAATVSTLGALASALAPSLPALAEQAFEVVARDAVVRPEREELGLQHWLPAALSGPHDPSWFRQLERVGRAHLRFGLGPCSLLASMTGLRNGLVRAARLSAAVAPGERAGAEAAIRALVDLALGVMLDAYHQQLSENVRGDEREATRGESEARHRAVVEAVPALVMALGKRGEIQIWNRRLEELTGFSRDEMLGSPGRELVGDGGERRLALKAGGHRLIRWQLAHVEATTFALGSDVTTERAHQRRTSMDERLAAVGTLAAGLAHEVRNPLNSATLQLQVLKRRLERGQNTPELLVPVVEIVHDEIRRLDRLVSDFLAFARPNPLVLEPMELSELMQSVADQLRPEAEAARVSIDCRWDGERGRIDGDRERLRQVLINLVRNGIEAMSPTGGALELGVQPGGEGSVEAHVEDTGPGFDENAPVFDAFYTTKAGGTGLGLAIVHRIVREHGGSIHFESRAGRTRFSLRFPCSARA